MSEQFKCLKCNNTGWILFKDEQGYQIAKPCDCEYGITSTLRRIGIPEKYLKCSFENFKINIPKAIGLKQAKTLLYDYVQLELFKSKKQSFLIKGTVGSGKTHLCAAVVRELVKKGYYNIYFVDFKELLDEIKSTFSYASDLSEADILFPVLNAGLLIIDDLGSERNTEWSEDVFARILNYRYNRDLPVIITTNYFDRQIPNALTEETLEERVGIRMRSRLYEMCRDIEIIAPDFRMLKNKI
ncbi:DNA replication protein DnaC [Thermotomaculum hydrothermale]|uniref:DNA replication protein DnaC n=1 Tax=Thermotomaculum hydrothermale TaxID=981385 RepID=A0A7R6SY85_9BACT|nr:ATP-binding protein [Thermotomaculum hydrothermale]BBB32296.1 DNA replication protein DnaC [Thermotomaculum hydrothermale]